MIIILKNGLRFHEVHLREIINASRHIVPNVQRPPYIMRNYDDNSIIAQMDYFVNSYAKLLYIIQWHHRSFFR